MNMTALGASTGLSTGAIVAMLAGLLVLNPLAGMALCELACAADRIQDVQMDELKTR